MENISAKCLATTRHISDKILMLRRAHKMAQEEFAERVGLDRRTIARAEDGKHRPSPETMELIAREFKVPISYFYDDSVFRQDVGKTALIYEINSKLSVISKANLRKILDFINLMNM